MAFFRFFAFELLCGLVLVQTSDWFANPFSFQQLLSWVLLAGSLALAVHGFGLLHRYGRSQGDFRADDGSCHERSFSLRTAPMYSSLLLLACGAFLKSISLVSAGLAVLTALSLCSLLSQKSGRILPGRTTV